jgi:hypothetical protein
MEKAEFILKTAKSRILASPIYKALPVEGLVQLLKEALSRCFADNARNFLTQVLEDLREGRLTEKDAERILADAKEFLGEDLFAAAKKQVIDAHKNAYKIGLGFSFTEADQDAIRLLSRGTLLPLKGYWDERIKDRLEEVLEQGLKNGFSRQKLAGKMEELFGEMVGAERSYFELVADLALYRAREFGRLSGYERGGIRHVRIDAALDGRTCKLCRTMHGRTMETEVLARQRDEYLAAVRAGNVEAMKQAHYMFSESKLRESGLLSSRTRTKELVRAGLKTPPFHFRCRCVTVAWFEPSSDWEKLKQRLVDGDLTAKDTREILKKAMSANWSKKKYGKFTSAEWHFSRHAEKLGAETLTDYNQFIQDFIRRGGRKVFVTVPDKIKDFPMHAYFVKKHGKGFLFLVMDLENKAIKSCFYRRRLRQAISRNDVVVELPEGVMKWTKENVFEYLERLWTAAFGH